jgi:hypothetical protein
MGIRINGQTSDCENRRSAPHRNHPPADREVPVLHDARPDACDVIIKIARRLDASVTLVVKTPASPRRPSIMTVTKPSVPNK